MISLTSKEETIEAVRSLPIALTKEEPKNLPDIVRMISSNDELKFSPQYILQLLAYNYRESVAVAALEELTCLGELEFVEMFLRDNHYVAPINGNTRRRLLRQLSTTKFKDQTKESLYAQFLQDDFDRSEVNDIKVQTFLQKLTVKEIDENFKDILNIDLKFQSCVLFYKLGGSKKLTEKYITEEYFPNILNLFRLERPWNPEYSLISSGNKIKLNVVNRVLTTFTAQDNQTVLKIFKELGRSVDYCVSWLDFITDKPSWIQFLSNNNAKPIYEKHKFESYFHPWDKLRGNMHVSNTILEKYKELTPEQISFLKSNTVMRQFIETYVK